MTRSSVVRTSVVVATIALGLAGWTAWSTADADSAVNRRAEVLHAYAKLPLAFVENRGQADARVRFYAHGPRYAFHLTRDAALLSFMEDARGTRGVTLGLRFIGGNPAVVVEGERRAPGEANYLRGNEPAGWQTSLRRHSQVVYRELWPGIDMMLRGGAETLKYEFRVRPGARISDIRLAYSGANGIELDGRGGLLIQTPLGVMHDAAPLAYQEVAGTRVLVASRYDLSRSASGDGEYGFVVGTGYDPARALVIDPGLDYSTFLGGASHEIGYGIAVDSAGDAYVTGFTQSPDFPTTAGAFDRTGSASNSLDAFVTKLNANGSALVYSTFLGGSNFEWGRAITIDAAGNAYIAGQTKSADFPTTGGAFDRTFNVDTCPRCGIDQYDAFVTKLNATGSALVYSTFLGGFDIDDALSVAVDASGNAYVAGETGSSNFPVTSGAFDTTRNGEYDAFVTKLNATGSALVYSTYLGGLFVDFIWNTQIDASGNAYVVGSTRSPDFPTVAGSFDTTHNGEFDAFATKLNPAGSALVYSTFLGGSAFDSAAGVAVDGGGNAYVAGGTGSPDFPTTAGAFDRTTGGGYITKLNATGSAVVYSTFLAGASATGVVVDGTGNAWFAGATSSPDFPATTDAFDTSHNGMADAVVAALNPDGSALVSATFIGGAQSDVANGIALDPGGNAIVVGHTYSADFPTTVGAFDRVWNGDLLIFWGDAFVTKIATGAAPPPPPPPPPPSGPLPAPSLLSPPADARFSRGTSITFDWTDVSGAATYTVHIDDSESFSAPLIVQQTTTVSRYVTSTLPARRMWFRVRANDAAGAPGTWSASRRFEVR